MELIIPNFAEGKGICFIYKLRTKRTERIKQSSILRIRTFKEAFRNGLGKISE